MQEHKLRKKTEKHKPTMDDDIRQGANREQSKHRNIYIQMTNPRNKGWAKRQVKLMRTGNEVTRKETREATTK